MFDRQEQIVVVRARRALVPMAELEFLREVEAPGGRIVDLHRTTGDGRELHLVTVEVRGGGQRVVTFDAGPTLLDRFRDLTNGLQVVIYVMAGSMALGAVYTLLRAVIGPR